MQLWLCVDCTFAEVNGDYSGMTWEREQDVRNALRNVGGVLLPNWDDETEDAQITFSRHPCDCCGSDVAGTRDNFVLLERK